MWPHRIVHTFSFALAGLLVCLVPAKAQAAWYEASSDNFVIYADDKEKDIRRFSENLERYHRAMEFMVRRRLPKPSPSNRVVIFAVGTGGELRRVFGKGGSRVAGFYIPRAGASRAFVQDIRNKDGYPDFSTVVMLHEYAHHFLISTSRFEMPRWMSEGMAEFFSAAGFPSNGGVLIGRPAQHRSYEISSANRMDVRGLLQAGAYGTSSPREASTFYGRSWLLYHYLQFKPERRDQFDIYQNHILRGKSSLEAGELAFGNLGKLESELMSYRRQRSKNMFELKPEALPIGEITIRRLSEGEAAVMPMRIRSQRGVTREQALKLLPDVREVAARYPNDAGVLDALSEAEHDAGNDDAAIAAADRAIALDPSRTNAYVQKGYSLFRKAGEAEDKAAAYQAAMQPFEALNSIENDHPMPLIYYYRSFALQGIDPPENARAALERAAQLAPFDKGLWFNVALMQMQEGKVALAKVSLQPIAFAPHGGARADQARKLMAMLDTMPEGEPVSLRDVAEAGDGGGNDETEGEAGGSAGMGAGGLNEGFRGAGRRFNPFAP